MTCKTCRREDMPETCGPRGENPCPCCGMRIIARAEESTEIPHNEGSKPEAEGDNP